MNNTLPLARKPVGRRVKPLVCLASFFVAISAWTARAAELNPAHVPADAQWLIHIDTEALSDSQLAEKIRSQKPEITDAIHQWMEQRYGVNPPEDLFSVTMFSRDYREYTGTVIIQADYDAAKIEQRVSDAKNHQTTQWDDYTLHTLTLSKQKPSDDEPSGDQEMTVVMVDEKTLLLASSVDNAKETLKLLAGETKSLKDQDSPLLTEQAKTAWVYGAAQNLGELKDHDFPMPVLAQHQRIVWAFGENAAGQLYEQGELVAQSEEVAGQMQRVLEGLVAYGTLRAEGSQAMTAIMQDVQVSRDGATTKLNWQGETEQVSAAMDDAMERLKEWKPLLMGRSSNARSRLESRSDGR